MLLGPALEHLPAPAHAQVAAQDQAALEAQEQVLADRLDRLEPAAVEPLGREHRAARGCGVSTVTRSPTSACSRRAARWSESPSGISRLR